MTGSENRGRRLRVNTGLRPETASEVTGGPCEGHSHAMGPSRRIRVDVDRSEFPCGPSGGRESFRAFHEVAPRIPPVGVLKPSKRSGWSKLSNVWSPGGGMWMLAGTTIRARDQWCSSRGWHPTMRCVS